MSHGHRLPLREDVLEIHADQVERYGGEHEVRDLGLLETALMQPRAGIGGEYLPGDLFEMAAAYALHLVPNHLFLDGNKRAGAAAALVFLNLNGIQLAVPKGAIQELILATATGNMAKPEIAAFFRAKIHTG